MHHRKHSAILQAPASLPQQRHWLRRVQQVEDHRLRLRAGSNARAVRHEITQFGPDVVQPEASGLPAHGSDHRRLDIQRSDQPVGALRGRHRERAVAAAKLDHVALHLRRTEQLHDGRLAVEEADPPGFVGHAALTDLHGISVDPFA